MWTFLTHLNFLQPQIARTPKKPKYEWEYAVDELLSNLGKNLHR